MTVAVGAVFENAPIEPTVIAVQVAKIHFDALLLTLRQLSARCDRHLPRRFDSGGRRRRERVRC